jgi:hypothetical protein
MKRIAIALICLILSGCSFGQVWSRVESLWAGDRSSSKRERLQKLGFLKPGQSLADDQYKYHYNFWSIWHSELVESLESTGAVNDRPTNKRRLVKSAGESYKRLAAMQGLLQEEQQLALTPHIQKMEHTVNLLEKEPTETVLRRLSRTMAREKRAIQKRFTYKKMQDYLVGRKAFQTDLYEESDEEENLVE